MSWLTSPNTTRAQWRNSSAPLSRRTLHSIKFIGAAGITLLASANTLANAAESPARMAQEQHACAVVMGLHQPGDLYDTCISSLSKSLSELDHARLMERNRNACTHRALRLGTPAFAVCVITAEQPPADTGRDEPITFLP